MKVLVAFICLVFLGSTSLVQLFKAPRNMFVGEPTTSISVMPPSQLDTALDRTLETRGFSIGEMMSNIDVPSAQPVSTNDGPLKSIDNSTRQLPVKTVLPSVKVRKKSLVGKDLEKEPADDPAVVKLKDDLVAETNKRVVNNQDLAAIKARIVANVKTEMELPVQAPVDGSRIGEFPLTDKKAKLPTVRVGPVKSVGLPLVDSKIKDDVAIKKTVRRNNLAKQRAQEIAAKKKLAKAAALKAQTSNNWQSAILGED